MEQFINRHGERISGVISCFDRLVFRGYIRQIQYAKGLEKFLNYQNILLKDFGTYVKKTSAIIKDHARMVAEKFGRPHIYLQSPGASKDEIAREIARKDGVTDGLVCVLTCVEPCKSYEIYRNKETKELELVNRRRQCLHMYFYCMDRDFGLTYVRLETWFPFNIQIGFNGHGYLARQMDKAGIAYERADNCFTWIEKPEAAQKLADKMLHTNWPRLLAVFARRINPIMKLPRQERPDDYYWVAHQTEYSTDVMFKDASCLKKIYPLMTYHAIEHFSSDCVMRFFGKSLHGNFKGDLTSHRVLREEGVCVKHKAQNNSIKMYDKAGSVLRIEITINNPRMFRVYREVKGKRGRQWAAMRKGVADFWRRAEVSKCANERYLEALSVVGDAAPSCEILDTVSRRKKRNGRTFRPLQPVAPDDAAFFAAVMRGEHFIQGFRNRDIRDRFFSKPAADPGETRRRSNRVSYRLRLLRAHGLIRKVPNTRYYRITKKGHRIMLTALEFRKTSMKLLQKRA